MRQDTSVRRIWQVQKIDATQWMYSKISEWKCMEYNILKCKIVGDFNSRRQNLQLFHVIKFAH